MSRRWLASLLPLLLSACFASDRPTIRSADLATPADLPGKYWSVSIMNGNDISVAEFASRRGHGFTVKTGGEEKPSQLRLVRIVAPNLYLMIDDDDKSSMYYLIHREKGGAWRIADMDVDDESPFANANFAFFNLVSSRHGFTIEQGGEATPINGPVKNGRIPELFRDPEFLGALRLDDMSVYLPFRAVSPRDIAAGKVANSLREIRLKTGLPFSQRYADPPQFAGSYLDRSYPFLGSDPVIEVKKLPDGRFSYGTFQKLALLRIAGDDERYLAICESDYGKPGEPALQYGLRLVQREDDGWRIRDINSDYLLTLPEINAMREHNMRAAARRAGMDFSESQLSGDITAEHLIALFNDGQFTSGVRIEEAAGTHLWSKETIIRLLNKVRTSTKDQTAP